MLPLLLSLCFVGACYVGVMCLLRYLSNKE